MRIRPILAAILAGWALGAGAAVTVTFTEPERYADARSNVLDRQDVMNHLERHFKQLGDRYLTPRQSLKIEVLDVDLAGEKTSTARREIRVQRGQADIPKITLRYTFEPGDGTRRQGEETISDTGYQTDRLQLRSSSGETLYAEKRMLETWFKQKFARAP